MGKRKRLPLQCGTQRMIRMAFNRAEEIVGTKLVHGRNFGGD